MYDFKMPSLGADMEAGTLLKWLIKPGDTVKRGQIIAVVDTDKAAVEVEVWEGGVVDRILVEPGTKVPVGTTLAVLRGAGEVATAAQPPLAPAPEPMPRALAAQPAPMPAAVPRARAEPSAAPVREPSRLRVSPAARRRAEELGVALAGLQGTGPQGAVTQVDVENAAKAPIPSAPAAPVSKADAMRAAIAATMARSKREIPHYYLGCDIELNKALSWLAERNSTRPVTERLLYSALLIRAVALAARETPELNGFWVKGAFQPARSVHVGIAVSLRRGGLVAPALHDVDRKDLDTVMRELMDLVSRARSGSLRSSEMSDPTITVTNLGEQGVDSVFGIIFPPQVALVGFGKILEQPRLEDGKLASRPVIRATLSADHRASDGHRGGVFLAAISRLLQEPEKL